MNDEPTYEDMTHEALRDCLTTKYVEPGHYWMLKVVIYALLTIAAAIEKRSA